jgi:hypothetical protein
VTMAMVGRDNGCHIVLTTLRALSDSVYSPRIANASHLFSPSDPKIDQITLILVTVDISMCFCGRL